MTPRDKQLKWVLPLVLYALFLWHSPYAIRYYALWVLDWLLPAVVLGLWAWNRWRRQAPWPRTALDGPLLAWGLVTVVTAAFSFDQRGTLRGMWGTLIWMLIFWLVVDAVRRGWGSAILRAIYLTSGVVCLLGIAEFLAWYFGWSLLPNLQQGWWSIYGVSQPFPPMLHRLTWPLGPATILSAFLALLIPPAIAVVLSTPDRQVRWGLVLWLGAAGLNMLLALSRGGFLALGVSLSVLAVVGFFYSQKRRPIRPATARRVQLVGIVVAVLVITGGGLLVAFQLSRTSHQSGDAVREDLWRSAVAMIRDHPWTGVGPSAFGTALRLYRTPQIARDHVDHAHNLFLNTASERGLPGLLVLGWLLFALAQAWRRQWRAQSPGSLAWWRTLGLGAALAGFVAQFCVDSLKMSPAMLVATVYAATILAAKPNRPPVGGQKGRWVWAVALALLITGAVGLAWDSVGYRYFLQSRSAVRRGETDRAIVLADKARRHDPGMPLYTCHAAYLRGLQAAEGQQEALPQALDLYDTCLAGLLAPGWLDQLNAAVLLWEAGQGKQARALVEAATEQMPLEWLPWLHRGLWAEAVGDREKAAQSYGHVLALDPDLAGSPFWQQGARPELWPSIVAAGQSVVAERGENPLPWQWQLDIAAGRGADVAPDIALWLEEHPDDAEALAWLGEALVEHDPAEALTWLDQALERAPARSRTWVARGEAALSLGRLAEAERAFRTALFLEPGPRAHLGLARLARSVGDQAGAMQEYEQALRPLSSAQPSDLVLYRRLSYPALLPQVTRIGYRTDAEAALEWAALLEAQGDLETAQKVYSTVLSLDSSLADVIQQE